MNVPNYFQLYNDSILKIVYNFVNNDKSNMISHILTKNRSIKMFAQNKCTTFDSTLNATYVNKQSFTEQARNRYNKINRGLSLCPNKYLFKKWLYKSHTMAEYDRYPDRIDNYSSTVPWISHQTIDNCHT